MKWSIQSALCLWLAVATAADEGQDAGDWAAAVAKAEFFVSQLSLSEKSDMVTGVLGLTSGCIGNIKPIPRLNFSGLCLLDGPTAVNRADLVSVFPSGVTAAASWDRDLIFLRGKYLGEEFRGKGANVMLGPVAGPLGRHPLGGRNWEGFSPDPYLTGLAMNATISGIQSVGVQACSKHFIGNEQETQRSNTFDSDGTEIAAISSNIDDRTLHELYLWPFADAVKAGTASVMCSYNRLNQTYACENDHLLNGLLKTELGFEGYVMSDWFATHSGPAGINAGQDMDMPGVIDIPSLSTGASYFGGNITNYINAGSISEARLNDMVRRVMTPYYYWHQDSAEFPTVDPSLVFTLAASSGLGQLGGAPAARDVRGDHAAFIRTLGAEATVLLKNTNGALPLGSPKNIAVFGNDATDPIDGLTYGSTAYEIGTYDVGGGSGTGRHVYLVSPLEAVRYKAKQIGARLQYIIHNQALAANDFIGLFPSPDVCLVFIGTYASEGEDRTDYENDWDSTLAVENVASRCPNTIVVTHSAGINVLPFANNPNVTAILAAHFPGQESGNSIVDVLWGDVSPSGRLPYTIPKTKADGDIPIVNLTGAVSPTGWQSDFSEGQFIDYRHYDLHNITPQYEFGFGLGYTTFALDTSSPSSVQVEQLVAGPLPARPSKCKKTAPGGNPDLWTAVARVTCRVANTGARAGAAVPQLYVAFPRGGQGQSPEGTPVQVLRGFDKVALAGGESRDVAFELRRRDLSYWDVASQSWVLPSGSFEFRVGFSSRDIRATVQKVFRE